MSGRDFWSRRKAAVAAEEAAIERHETEVQAEAREAELAERSDEEILDDLGLPDPDSLEKGDDFRVFLAEAVPARIRKRALRRLWLSNPVLANLDELVDYGEDFTDAACVIDGLQTTYEVGKGMARHVEELARQAEAEDEDVAEVREEAGAEAGAGDAEDDAADASRPTNDNIPAPLDAAPAPEPDDLPATRRMKFRFDETGAVA